MTHLDDAVRAVLEMVPGSLRALAKEAGVPHSTLVRIKQGRLGASPSVAEAVAGALARNAERYRTAEHRLRETLSREEKRNE